MHINRVMYEYVCLSFEIKLPIWTKKYIWITCYSTLSELKITRKDKVFRRCLHSSALADAEKDCAPEHSRWKRAAWCPHWRWPESWWSLPTCRILFYGMWVDCTVYIEQVKSIVRHAKNDTRGVLKRKRCIRTCHAPTNLPKTRIILVGVTLYMQEK